MELATIVDWAMRNPAPAWGALGIIIVTVTWVLKRS